MNTECKAVFAATSFHKSIRSISHNLRGVQF